MSSINTFLDHTLAESEFQPGEAEYANLLSQETATSLDPLVSIGGFLSEHEGGANFCFADASVKLLSNQIDSKVCNCLEHIRVSRVREERLISGKRLTSTRQNAHIFSKNALRNRHDGVLLEHV